MFWTVCFLGAVVVLIIALAFVVFGGKSKNLKIKLMDPTKTLLVAVALATLLLFLPIYASIYKDSTAGILETIFISIHNVIRLFVVDADFDFIASNLTGMSSQMATCYAVLFSVLFVVAPVLTFGFVLSFFSNVSAYQKLLLNFRSDIYVFSELNVKALALAQSLKTNTDDKRNKLIVFTNVEEKADSDPELVKDAKNLGALCFQNDIASINFAIHSKKSKIFFFTISDDENANVSLGLKLVARYKDRNNTRLYVSSTHDEAEYLLNKAFETEELQEKKREREKTASENEPAEGFKVRRVNEVRSLVQRLLYDRGTEIFDRAVDSPDGNKQICAVILGMGRHGTEMAKALTWFCQMDGYDARIHVYDVSPRAESKFAALCPELLDPRYNGHFESDQDARYQLTIHSGINVNTKEFMDEISKLPVVTYVFVALGNDDKNISTAISLRSLLARNGCDPQIQAVVYDTDKCNALRGIKNQSQQPYDIEFVGDLETSYCEAVILSSDIEQLALARHRQWGDTYEFWRYGYNYRSSIASAIHKKMKEHCNIPGIHKHKQDRTEAELWPLRRLEHRRWNAYMRTEGYTFGPKDHLTKQHSCLVPFDELPLKEQIKDDD